MISEVNTYYLDFYMFIYQHFHMRAYFPYMLAFILAIPPLINEHWPIAAAAAAAQHVKSEK